MSISIQRNLQKCMEDWKQISGLDFCLLSEDNSVFVATGERRIPSAGKLEDFRNGDALCTANASCCLYKVMDRDELLYILIVWGSGESTSTIGELAVCQIRSLIEAYSEKMTRMLLCRSCCLDLTVRSRLLTGRRNYIFLLPVSALSFSSRRGRPGMNMR